MTQKETDNNTMRLLIKEANKMTIEKHTGRYIVWGKEYVGN